MDCPVCSVPPLEAITKYLTSAINCINMFVVVYGGDSKVNKLANREIQIVGMTKLGGKMT